MRKICNFLLVILVAALLTACSAGGSTTVTGSTAQTEVSTVQEGSTVQQAVSVATDPVPTEQILAENAGTHEDVGDYDIDLTAAVPITLNGDTIDASGAGISVDGSTVTITAPGDYRLSGSLTDGQVIVNSTGDGAVRLILDSASLNSSTSSPLYIMEADKVILFLPDGSTSTITDAAPYVYASADVDEPNGAIFSKADLSIAGNGALAVTGSYKDGINSKDGLVIAGGIVSVTAVDDGIIGKDYLVINGGSLTVNAGGDGLKSDNAEDAARGYITVTAGTINVTAGGDAISAQTDVTITGGEFALSTGGGAGSLVSDTLSAKGIKGDVNVAIEGGTFNINTADDSIHSNGSVTINNGIFTLASADDAMHTDAALTINGGEIRVTQSYEGLESAVITINDGTMHITSSDDGVNVASGVDGSGMMRGPGGGGGQDAAAYTGDLHLYINGGYLFVDAQGDGIDVGGAIEMTDGVVLVNGPTEQMNGPIDYDAGFNITGGFLVATGSAGMAQTAGQASTQNAALIYLTSTQPGGTPVAVVDSTGKVVFTFTPTRGYQSVAFSSPELVSGQTYTLYTGGSASGASTDGYAEDGSYTPGSEAASFTVSSTVTTVGTGGWMGGGHPGRGTRP